MPQPNAIRSVWRFAAIGTEWSIETDIPLSVKVKEMIEKTIEAFDQTYSRFRPDSLVTQISHTAGNYIFPDSAIELFDLYKQLYIATEGKVTPLVGRLLENLGYDATYSLVKKNQKVTVPALESLQWNGTQLTVTQPILIDIGAIGKGYLVDSVAALLAQEHQAYTIDASGDIYTAGAMGERIGLEDPHEEGKVLGVVSLQNASLCGSATNRRRWGADLHHIVDPDTGSSTKGIAATWVIAQTAALADGLATALFFTDPEVLQKKFIFEYICFNDNRSMRYSKNMEIIA